MVTDEQTSMEHWHEKLYYSEKNLSKHHFVSHKSHINWPGIGAMVTSQKLT